MAITFRADRGGIEALKRGRELSLGLGDVAKAITAEAQRLARAEAYETGQYMRSIQADVVLEADGVTARVNAHDYKANWIEYGSRGIPGKAILRRATESVVGTAQMRAR